MERRTTGTDWSIVALTWIALGTGFVIAVTSSNSQWWSRQSFACGFIYGQRHGFAASGHKIDVPMIDIGCEKFKAEAERAGFHVPRE